MQYHISFCLVTVVHQIWHDTPPLCSSPKTSNPMQRQTETHIDTTLKYLYIYISRMHGQANPDHAPRYMKLLNKYLLAVCIKRGHHHV